MEQYEAENHRASLCGSPSPTILSPPISIAGGPLQATSPDRVNQLTRDNSVHDKISQFNNLSVAMQSKQLERRTADAALKRAMVGREEAEAELQKVREEMRLLQLASQEDKMRERKVSERLEALMESHSRAKETHAHTQALWEKEIRRARKENFKTQSVVVKLQEELKTARSAVKILEESVERAKERARVRENEAFNARYQLVGVQEQLDDAHERIKLVEQERDAFRTAAKEEEVARIAAEGRIPLPTNDDPDDEFASPRKPSATLSVRAGPDTRLSLSAMELMSSASSEMEIEELTTQLLWERQRADRSQEMMEFLQAECQMHCCHWGKKQQAAYKGQSPPSKRRRQTFECPAENDVDVGAVADDIADVDDDAHATAGADVDAGVDAGEDAGADAGADATTDANVDADVDADEETGPTADAEIFKGTTSDADDDESGACAGVQVEERETGCVTIPENTQDQEAEPDEQQRVGSPEPEHGPRFVVSRKKKTRRSTIFCPQEGIFRTVFEHEVEAILSGQQQQQHEGEKQEQQEVVGDNVETQAHRASPQSELEAEAEPEPEIETGSKEQRPILARTPSVEPPAFAMMAQSRTSLESLLHAPHEADCNNENHDGNASTPLAAIPTMSSSFTFTMEAPATVESSHDDDDIQEATPCVPSRAPSPEPRPHTSATMYMATRRTTRSTRSTSTRATRTTTTTVPLRGGDDDDSTTNTTLRSSGNSSLARLRTPSSSSNVSFDHTNPALTPTMTREQALAKIRERRGRVRSAAQASSAGGGGGPSAGSATAIAATPRRPGRGVGRRDMSAPTASARRR